MKGATKGTRSAVFVVSLLALASGLTGSAAAGEEPNWDLKALAPIHIEGRGVATTYDSGAVGLAGGASDASMSLTGAAAVLTVHEERYRCLLDGTPFFPESCTQDGPQSAPETLQLNDLELAFASPVRSAFDVQIGLARGPAYEDAQAATPESGESGFLTVRHGDAAGARLDLQDYRAWSGSSAPGPAVPDHGNVAPAPLRFAQAARSHVAGYGVNELPAPFGARGTDAADPANPARANGWGGSSTWHEASDFRYLVDKDWVLDGSGPLSLTIFDVDVRLRGTTTDGEAYDEVIETGEFRETESGSTVRTVRYLSVGVAEAQLHVQSDGPGGMAGPLEARALDGVFLREAHGSVSGADDAASFDGEDTQITDELTLIPVGVEVDHDTGDVFILMQATIGEPVSLAAPPPQRSTRDTAESAAAGAVAFGLLGAIAAVGYYWPTWRFGLTGMLLPLYSRIERDEVLGHDKREEIYKLIQGAPGIHAHEISAKAGIGWGTTVYHLRMLENHHLVVSKRQGRYKRFFMTSGATGATKDAYAALRNDTASKIAQFVLANPGAAQKDVCAALGLSPSLVSWHVDRLDEADLVKKMKEGRRVRYYAGPAWNALNMNVLPMNAGVAGGTPHVPSASEAAVADGPEAN